MPGAEYRHRTAGLFPPKRYFIHRTPDSIRRETVALAKASATPRMSAAVPPVDKVYSAPNGDMPEKAGEIKQERRGHYGADAAHKTAPPLDDILQVQEAPRN